MIKKSIVLFLLLLVPAMLMAQSSGKIKGVIRDQASGEALPGVNVMVENTKMGAVTNLDGYYVIMNVPVGTYSISVSLMGYKKLTMENISVSADVTTELNFDLEETVIQGEEVVIVADKPLVEKHMTQSYSKVSADDLRNTPVKGINDILAVQPSIVVQDDNVHIRGGREEEVGYYLDGAAVSNPMDRSNALYVIQDAVEEVQVLAGGYTAEYGGANSGIVKTQMKTGGAKMEASVDFQTDKFAGEGDKFLNTHSYKEHYLTASLGGPLLTKNLRFFVAVENRDQGDYRRRFSEGFEFTDLSDRSVTNPNAKNDTNLYSIDYKDGFTPKNRRNRWAVNTTLLYDFNPFRFRLSGVYNWRKTYYTDVPMLEVLNDRERYNQLNQYLVSGTFTHVITPRLYYDLKFSLFNQKSEYLDEYFDDDWKKWNDSVAVAQHTNGEVAYRNLTQGPWDYMFNGFEFSRNGSLPNNYYTLEEQAYYAVSGNVVAQVGQYHELKMGFDFRRYTIRRFSINTRVIELFERDSSNNLIDTPMSDIGKNKWQSYMGNTYGYDFEGNELDDGFDGAKHPVFGAFYFQDKLEYKHLIINAGVRVDYFKMDDYKLKNPANPEVDSDEGVFADEAWEERDATVRVSPRLGFSFPASDKTIFYMQYGKFVQMTELNDIYYGSSQFARQIIKGGLYFLGGLGFDMGPISTTSYEIGFRQQLANFASIDVSGFYKNIKGQPQIIKQSTEAEASVEAYDRLVNGDFSTTKGFELQFNSRRKKRVQASVSYTLTDAQGTNSAEDGAQGAIYFGQPAPTIVSPLDWSQTHRGTMIFDYRFDAKDPVKYMRNFGINLLFTFNSGHPYTRIFTPVGGATSAYDAGVSYMNDTRDRQSVEPINSSTTPWTYRADLRIDKTFQLGKYQATIYCRVYNLFNQKNVANVYQLTGSAEDDGILSDSQRAKNLISTWGEDFVDMYRAINLENGQAYWDVVGGQLYEHPRQIFFGIRFSY